MKDEVAFEREPEAVSKATESFVTTIYAGRLAFIFLSLKTNFPLSF